MEVKQSLANLGIEITKEEAEKILNRYFLLIFFILSRKHGTWKHSAPHAYRPKLTVKRKMLKVGDKCKGLITSWVCILAWKWTDGSWQRAGETEFKRVFHQEGTNKYGENLLLGLIKMIAVRQNTFFLKSLAQYIFLIVQECISSVKQWKLVHPYRNVIAAYHVPFEGKVSYKYFF